MQRSRSNILDFFLEEQCQENLENLVPAQVVRTLLTADTVLTIGLLALSMPPVPETASMYHSNGEKPGRPILMNILSVSAADSQQRLSIT